MLRIHKNQNALSNDQKKVTLKGCVNKRRLLTQTLIHHSIAKMVFQVELEKDSGSAFS